MPYAGGMPERALSASDWATLVNLLVSARHFLHAIPRPPELDAAVNDHAHELDRALDLLGFDLEKDRHQLKQWFEIVGNEGTGSP